MRALARKIRNRLKGKIKCETSHGDMIRRLLLKYSAGFSNPSVFVETGCGLSTIALAEGGNRISATVCSCDYNTEKSDELRAQVGDKLNNVQFYIGDSLESLERIANQYNRIDFLFLDSAASAMHTFREFTIVEDLLKAGTCLLVDNAALPKEKHVLGPVRKGKVLVPYLLASPFWEVTAHPSAGDSMVAAVKHEEGAYSDPEYEHPEYIDNWRTLFENKL